MNTRDGCLGILSIQVMIEIGILEDSSVYVV